MPNRTQVSSSGFVRGEPYTLKASGAEIASTTGPAIEVPDLASMSITVAITAGSGTPQMTVVIEGSDDGTNWYTLGTIGLNGYAAGTTATAPTNFTGAATTRACLPCPGLVRYRSVIAGGTPSLTYSITAG